MRNDILDIYIRNERNHLDKEQNSLLFYIRLFWIWPNELGIAAMKKT